MSADSVKKKMLGGLGWNAFNSWGGQLIQFATTLVLARLLTPADFGVMAMANTVTLLANTLNEFGISSSLVHRQDVEERHLSSAFWANLGFGTLLSLVIWGSSGPVARFYGSPQLGAILAVLSLVFMISSTKVVHSAQLTRRLQFGKLAAASLLEMLANSLVAIGCAWSGLGVWSLVWGRLVGISVGTLATIWASPWRPRFSFDLESFKELFRFGVYAMGVNAVSYLIMNLDNVVVGRVGGVVALGFYSMAYNIVTLPQKKISALVSKVAFPVMSRMQDDREGVANTYLKILALLSFITFPLLAGMAAVAPEFIACFLGAKWAAVALPLQILCFAGMLRAIGTTVGSVFFSQGRPDLEFKLDLCSVVALFFFLRVGIAYDVVGVAVAVCCHYLLTQLFYFRAVGSLIGRSLGRMYRDSALNLIYACAMALIVVLTKKGLALLGLNVGFVLAGAIVAGCLAYLAICYLFNRTLLEQCCSLVGLRLPGKVAVKDGVALS